MLIIAQPKTGSSALVKTVAEILGGHGHISVKRDAKEKRPEEFAELHKWHSTIAERPRWKLRGWAYARDRVIKEHVPPTGSQMDWIAGLSCNVLFQFREVEDSLDAYRRFGERNKKKLDLKKIEQELNYFQHRWHELCINQPWQYKAVWYDELVLDYDNAMTSILYHFDINVPPEIPELKKVYYTGVGEQRLEKTITGTEKTV
jgi:hypothetical protein